MRPQKGDLMKKSRRSLLIFLCAVLAVVTVIFFIYRWREQVKGSNNRPVISCPDYPLRVSVSAIDNTDLLLQDVTASDMEDGDITDSIVVESISQFVETGHCIVTYAAFDNNNRVAKATRHLYFTDYTSPTFDIIAPLEFSYSTNFSPLECIEAHDCIDGDITKRVKMTWLNADDDITNIGAHNVEFSVTNSMGDTVRLEAEIVVYDRTYTELRLIPTIKLKQYLMYVEPNMYVDFIGDVVESISVMGEDHSVADYEARFGKLTVDEGGFDANEPGTYRVLYTCENGSEYVGSAVLIVIVKGGEINNG